VSRDGRTDGVEYDGQTANVYGLVTE